MAPRLDPYSLQRFPAAAEEGSLARAATRGHIARSALSRRIGDLETVFGTPLFIRSAHGITLTGAGRAACEAARRFQASLVTLSRGIQCASGTITGHPRLFANASSVVGFLPGRWKAFAADPLPVVPPAGHDLAAKPSLRFAEVLRHPLVCVQAGGSRDQLLRDRAAASRLDLTVAVTVNRFDSVCRIVEAGMGSRNGGGGGYATTVTARS